MNVQWKSKGNVLIEEILNTSLDGDSLALWYVGQMGIILKYKQTILAVDPVLNDLTNPDGTSRRNYAPPFEAERFNFADFILCTHNHADHLNLNTLLPVHQANGNTIFMVPAPVASILTSAGIPKDSVIGMTAEKEIPISEDISISPIAAAHEDYLVDEWGQDHYLGYRITCGPYHIYHAGDTLVTSRLKEELLASGHWDIAFLPINGRDEERHRRGIIGNMDHKEAAALADDIRASLTVPLHYDMVKNNGADPELFGEYMKNVYPHRNFKILNLGERLLYPLPSIQNRS